MSDMAFNSVHCENCDGSGADSNVTNGDCPECEGWGTIEVDMFDPIPEELL